MQSLQRFEFRDAVQQYLFQLSDVLPVGRRITGLLKLLKRDTKGFEGFSGRTRGHENGDTYPLLDAILALNSWRW